MQTPSADPHQAREAARVTFDRVADAYDAARPRYPNQLFADLRAELHTLHVAPELGEHARGLPGAATHFELDFFAEAPGPWRPPSVEQVVTAAHAGGDIAAVWRRTERSFSDPPEVSELFEPRAFAPTRRSRPTTPPPMWS